MKPEIKEAMDAGYAQGVLATEGKAIARITELEQENASYFKQAQLYLVEKEKAEAQVEKFHQGFILQQAEAEKLAAELKEQTRLGLACHDELAELKAKYQESEDGSKMVDAEIKARWVAEGRAEAYTEDANWHELCASRYPKGSREEYIHRMSRDKSKAEADRLTSDAENNPTNHRKGSDES